MKLPEVDLEVKNCFCLNSYWSSQFNYFIWLFSQLIINSSWTPGTWLPFVYFLSFLYLFFHCICMFQYLKSYHHLTLFSTGSFTLTSKQLQSCRLKWPFLERLYIKFSMLNWQYSFHIVYYNILDWSSGSQKWKGSVSLAAICI